MDDFWADSFGRFEGLSQSMYVVLADLMTPYYVVDLINSTLIVSRRELNRIDVFNWTMIKY